MNTIDVQTWSIGRVKVRDRLRRNVGDLDDLKASMTERGLINPLTIEADGTLIAGERRLRAAQQLGWQEIDVRIWRQADAVELLGVEVEENLCRKDLTPGEAELYAERLEALLRPEAEAAQQEARHRKGAGQDGAANFAGPSPEERRTRTKAAKVTGYSHETLKKVREVRTTAEDENQPEEVRAEAEHQHDRLMRGTTKVAPAHQAVKATRQRVKRQAQLKTGLGPGQWIEPPPPSKPAPTLGKRLVDAISKIRGLEELAAEIQDANLDLDIDTVYVLRNHLQEQVAAGKTLKGALDQEIERRGFNRRKRTP